MADRTVPLPPLADPTVGGMVDPGYDIDQEKARYRAERPVSRRQIRAQNKLDEDGEKMEASFDRGLARRLLAYLLPYRRQAALALLLLLAYSAVVPAFPRLIAAAVDNYIVAAAPPFSGFTVDQRLSGVLGIVAVYMGLRLLNFGLRYGYTYLVAWLGQHVIYDLRRHTFEKIQRLHLGFFDRTPVGRLITRITSDVEAIQQAMTDGVVGLIADIGMIIGLMVYMFTIDWRLALVTMAIMPLLFLILNFLRMRIRDAFRAIRLRTSRSTAYLAENITGMATVQLFNREQRNARRFDKLNLELLDANIEQTRWFSLFFPAVGAANSVAVSLILGFAAYQMVGPTISQTLTIGVLIAFIQYAQMFFRPLQELSERFNVLQAAMASAERIFSLIDTPELVRDPETPKHFAQPFRGEVRFEDVSFAYQDDDWVIRGLELTIQPGESVAFVGHTGAGKTTIISLLSRFYDVQRGRVTIDGIDVRELPQSELRKHVGIVLQDPFLFSGTIRSNITLGDDSIPLDRVIEACRFVNAHAFIEELPRGYDTPVRERGAGFSTGQKQLLAFARALVQNPDILLVLDEATANVDTETEELIQDALKKLMQGRTSIVIAHRLSTIQDVDRILVMRKGRLIEQGRHAELMKVPEGYYRKLVELQYQERPS